MSPSVFRLAALAFAIAGTSLPAQAPSVASPDSIGARVTTFLKDAHARGQFNGNALIARGDSIVVAVSFGRTVLEGVKGGPPSRPLDRESIFRLASLTKPFTATVLLKLAEDGRIDIDKPVQHYLPRFPYATLTPRQLLSHTSGLSEFMGPMFDLRANRQVPVTDSDVFEYFVTVHPALDFPPGTKYRYSNSGFVLLPMIAEAVTGEAFTALLERYVLKPAEMTRTMMVNAFSGPLPANAAARHWYDIEHDRTVAVSRGESKAGNFIGNTLGDGSLNSTTTDLLRFTRALVHGKILRDSTVAIAHRQVALADGSSIDYGLGWEVRKVPPLGLMVGHSGKFDGARSNLTYLPEQDLTVITLSNTENFYLSGLHRQLVATAVGGVPETQPLIISLELERGIIRTSIDELWGHFRVMVSQPKAYQGYESDFRRLAGNLWDLKQFDRGLAILEMNHELFPDALPAMNDLADGYLETGRYAKAAAGYRALRDVLIRRNLYDQSWKPYVEGQIGKADAGLAGG